MSTLVYHKIKWKPELRAILRCGKQNNACIAFCGRVSSYRRRCSRRNIDKEGGRKGSSNEIQKVYTAACVPGDLLTVLSGFPNLGTAGGS